MQLVWRKLPQVLIWWAAILGLAAVNFSAGFWLGIFVSPSVDGSVVSSARVINTVRDAFGDAAVYALPLLVTRIENGIVIGTVREGAHPRARAGASERKILLTKQITFFEVQLVADGRPRVTPATVAALVPGDSIVVVADSDLATEVNIQPHEIRIIRP